MPRETEVDLASEGNEATISGLHAKLFVIDDGWNACVWTGSANATVAAFQRNVEFLVELVGERRPVSASMCCWEKEVYTMLQHCAISFNLSRRAGTCPLPPTKRKLNWKDG